MEPFCITPIIAAKAPTWAEKISNHASFRMGVRAHTIAGSRIVARTQAAANRRKTRGKGPSGKAGCQRRELGQRARLGPARGADAGGCPCAATDVGRKAEPGAEGVRQHLPPLGESRSHD